MDKHVRNIYRHILGSKFTAKGRYTADGMYVINLSQLRKSGRNRGVVRSTSFYIEDGKIYAS